MRDQYTIIQILGPECTILRIFMYTTTAEHLRSAILVLNLKRLLLATIRRDSSMLIFPTEL